MTAGALQAAADDEGRILAALGQNAGDQARGRGLAMGARHCDGVAKAHQLAEHFGALHHRHATRRVPPALPGCRRATALDTTTTSASPTFSAAWPKTILAPSCARRRVTGVGLEIRALHLVAEIDAALRRCRPCRCRRCRRNGCAGCGACGCRRCADAGSVMRALPASIEHRTRQRFGGVRHRARPRTPRHVEKTCSDRCARRASSAAASRARRQLGSGIRTAAPASVR